MSLIEEILTELWNTTIYYKGMEVNLFGIPRFKSHSYGSMRSTLYRLHKRDLIQKRNNQWRLTSSGRKYMNRKLDSLQTFLAPSKKDNKRNLIVMFDVPEAKKAEREWLRWHLKKFNFIMIQKSVWVGPSPLPREFLSYVKKIGLKSSIKTFKLAKAYSV